MASQCFHRLPHHYVTWTIWPTPSIPACIISTPREHHDQYLFSSATQPSHHPTSQFRFVYALGLVCLISHYYAVPQCSTHPNRSCPVCGCTHSDSPSPLLTPPSPASRRLTGHRPVHAAPLRTYRSATSALRLRHVIGLPSSPETLAGFLVASVVSFDMLLIIFTRSMLASHL